MLLAESTRLLSLRALLYTKNITMVLIDQDDP